MNKKIQKIVINKDENILGALKKMNEADTKLLIIMSGSKFYSVVSIGDIQRALIQNKPLTTPIDQILRKKITIATNDEDIEQVKRRMLKDRIACMPVIDEARNLVDVLFWDDLFFEQYGDINLETLSIPVVIMAGGKGTRLRPLTNIIPKPLIPIGDKPIIEIIIQGFNRIGVTDFYLSVNYKHEFIRFYFDALDNKSYNLHYILESEPLGTAGGLYLLKDKIDSTFFVTNCDILINQDYREIFNYHREYKNDITIVSVLKSYSIPYGIIEKDDKGEFRTIREKPDYVFQINSGMYILEPWVISHVKDKTFLHITDLIEMIKARGGKIGVFPINDKSWLDIGDWNRYYSSIQPDLMKI